MGTVVDESSKFWDRQPGETLKAHAAFLTYRDLGADRTLAAVKRKLGKGFTINRWATRWRWVHRADQWDVEMQREVERVMKERVHVQMARHEQNVEEMLTIVATGLERVNAHYERDKEWHPTVRDLAYMTDAMTRLHRVLLGIDPVPGRGVAPDVPRPQQFRSREFTDSLRAWARSLPIEVRKTLGQQMDQIFEASIERDIAAVEVQLRLLKPPHAPDGDGQR